MQPGDYQDAHDSVMNTMHTRVARGAAWIIGGRIIVRSLGLINTLILARLLAPADFGLVAIGVTIMQLLQNISDIGVSKTVVRFRDAGRSQYDTLFTINIIRGVIISGLLVCLSFLAGSFYDDPRAMIVFLGLSPAPLFHSLVNPRYYEFERQLNFTREFVVTGLEKVVGVAVSISVAVIYQTYWALILGLVAGVFTQMIASYLMRAYAPRLSLAAIREIGGFTGWLTGQSFVAALNNKLDILIFGKFASQADVGAFFVGSSLASMPSDEIATPIARAIYPGFSELQHKKQEMQEAYLRGVEALGLIATPAAFGSAFVAADLVALLLGDQWDRVVPVIQYFTPAAGVMVILSATNGYALAHGFARLLFIRDLIYFLVRTPIFIAAVIYYGLIGAVLAVSADVLFLTALNAGLYKRISGGSIAELFWRVRRPFMGVAAMAFYFFLLRPQITFVEHQPLAFRLALDIAMGAVTYASAVLLIWRAEGRPQGVEAMLMERLPNLGFARSR
ncbi:MAG: lipopolysaccharide biosynthesis protein [Pseudomonadota bacterium]